MWPMCTQSQATQGSQAGAQPGQDLEAGAEAEAMEECRHTGLLLTTCSACFLTAPKTLGCGWSPPQWLCLPTSALLKKVPSRLAHSPRLWSSKDNYSVEVPSYEMILVSSWHEPAQNVELWGKCFHPHEWSCPTSLVFICSVFGLCFPTLRHSLVAKTLTFLIKGSISTSSLLLFSWYQKGQKFWEFIIDIFLNSPILCKLLWDWSLCSSPWFQFLTQKIFLSTLFWRYDLSVNLDFGISTRFVLQGVPKMYLSLPSSARGTDHIAWLLHEC